MGTLLSQLLALAGDLTPVAGVTQGTLDELRVFLAAILIQQDSGIVTTLDPSTDPSIKTSLLKGIELATELTAARTQIRFKVVNELAPTFDPEKPAHVFGPFVTRTGDLQRFLIFQSAAFLSVHNRAPNQNPLRESVLLLPRNSALRAGTTTFDIPAGTVWIESRFIVPRGSGFVGLPVAGGTLTMASRGTLSIDGVLLLPDDGVWALEVEPEQPGAGEAGGSDANGVQVRLPAVLSVKSNGSVAIKGSIGISGFGTSVVFDTPSGAPATIGASIVFPYSSPGPVWALAGNRSTAAQIDADCKAPSAVWSLLINPGPSSSLGEAANGGSVVVQMRGVISVIPAGMTGGAFGFGQAILTANSDRIQLDGAQAKATGRIDLNLWRPAISRLVFGKQSIGHVSFLSERGLGDLALIQEGGSIRNRWDLPLRASGTPFGFEGAIEAVGILARPTALYLSCIANQDPGIKPEALALENLFLTVRAPRRLVLQGAYDGIAVADGRAILLFDVVLAQPTLPDPYVANWSLPPVDQAQPQAFSTALQWIAQDAPSIVAQLEQTVRFPEPLALHLDDDLDLRGKFDTHLRTGQEALSLLDLSSNDHLFGVSIEPLSHLQPTLTQNKLSVQLHNLRLLMQPQVLWEPVQDGATLLTSTLSGGRTLAGTRSVKLVPILPGVIAQEWTTAAQQRVASGALFSLPFGIRAFARLDPTDVPSSIAAIEVALREVNFGPGLTSARQLRLSATDGQPPEKRTNPARTMTGEFHQMPNLQVPNAPGLKSVIDDPIINLQLSQFIGLPLHQVDLSGYGLSTFSNWHQEAPGAVGITQARFDVLNGRTSLEIIQARTVLAPCQAHLVMTIVMERRNSGKVLLFNSGWVAVDDGLFASPAPFDKGVVKAFRKIRRVRLLNTPALTLADKSVWQQVLYDCDAELENVIANGVDGRVPALDQTGYVQVLPVGPAAAPTAARIAALFAAVDGPIGGRVDCAIRVGGTLDMHLSGIFADAAPLDGIHPLPGFVVAAYGSPKLPRAGQWSTVSVSAVGEASPVDPRHGIPVIRLGVQPYIFRDAADANRGSPATEYGLLMATPTSRILFPKPSINPIELKTLRTAAPIVADPLALAQATSVFPRVAYAMRSVQDASFEISDINNWKLTAGLSNLSTPAPDLAKGGEWAVSRFFPVTPKLTGLIDSALEDKSWDLGLTPNDLNIDIDPFGTIFTISTNYQAASDVLGKLQNPTLLFGPVLDAVKDLVDILKNLSGIGFDFDVDVTVPSPSDPSFIINIALAFLLGEGPGARIDIGLGKFYGDFQIHGQLEAALSGSTRGSLKLEFQGDIQQAVLPPLLYAGGMFRFALEISDTGRPTIELGLGTTTSIGGDLIKDLLEVEATITYGYMLNPETLQPGVLLGLEARAKLLAGLIGFSFSVQAIAMVRRIDPAKGDITVFADIRVVATAHIAWLIDEDVDIRTQFEQTFPLGLAVLVAGGPGALAIASSL